ncbi:MAG: ribosome assembly cofactor RimP [Flavobacteriaceae bacterium]|nr:ribosome assembly cofactor RimP [Flavobacteriaceae bacterium]MDG1965401.1 ribosome assembly cofactor RimP [Flavobacteriaceae bacterium]
MNFNKKVEDLLTLALEEYSNIFLVELKISADKSIRVTLDGDEEVNVKDCINISRAIEGELDREEEDFSLEVASAGIGSPLKFPRQYFKNMGRKLEVVSKEGLKYEGALTKVSEDYIELEWKQREPKPIGKGKVTVTKNKTLLFDEISQTKVMIKF